MNFKKITGLIVMCFLLTGLAAADTGNDALPSKGEVDKLINNFEAPAGEDCLSALYDAYIEEFPEGHTDLLPEYITLYYKDSGSSKGYGSIYINKDGKRVTPACGCDKTPKKSYKGEAKDEEVKEDAKIVKDESEDETHTYDDLVKVLHSYTGKLSCSSKSCAENFNSYLKENGWETEVVHRIFKSVDSSTEKYGIKVTTDDEGDVYIVLG